MEKAVGKTNKSLAEKTRNGNLFLFKKNFTEQDTKILAMLQIEKVADAWRLSELTNIFITSVRRSLTGLKQLNSIKEVGTKIGIAGARNTEYALWRTTSEEIEEFRKAKELEERETKDLIDKCKNLLINKEEMKNMTV
ncbi:MAG: hypothetical protein PHN88_09170 [Ignavibacteria bacterium]|nr:hypothetical protein [Ignavibacteria bacterium]